MAFPFKIITDLSPNYDPIVIPVDFLVLHHTAATLEQTISIFKSPTSSVSSHLVICEDGTVYEMVPCMSGLAYRGWHAGISGYQYEGHYYEGFNDFSIGIELVNLNGNIYAYPEIQINSLISVTKHLISLYPNLNNPTRIVGHQEIAGFRGKIDPGTLFPFDDFKKAVYEIKE